MAANDFSRRNLVTSSICTGCGANLTLSFDKLGEHAPDAETSHGAGGAYVLENRIHVHPCKTCIERITAPARAISDAIKLMQGGA